MKEGRGKEGERDQGREGGTVREERGRKGGREGGRKGEGVHSNCKQFTCTYIASLPGVAQTWRSLETKEAFGILHKHHPDGKNNRCRSSEAPYYQHYI